MNRFKPSVWTIAFLMLGAQNVSAQPPEPGLAEPLAPTASSTTTPPDTSPESNAAPTRSVLGVEEIVVTAQRREEAINDVPIAISAFSGDALQQLGVTDTRDLGNIVPGLSVSNSGFNKPVYTLRGIGFNETSHTASSTVGVYIDELNFPFDIMTKGANLDIERVEVLKGPQGTLYGRNTTGGAINYVSRKPTESFESGLSGTYSSFQTTDVEGYASGALGESVTARLALRDIRSQEGWQYSRTRPGDELGKLDKQSGRLIVDWAASDDLPIRFMLQGWRDYSEPQAPQAIAFQAQNAFVGNLALAPVVAAQPLIPQDTDNARVADWSTNYPWQLRDSFYMGSVRGDWAMTDTRTLTLQGAYQDVRSDDSYVPQSGLGVDNSESRIFVHTTAYNLEARLADSFGDDGKWQAGLFFSQDDVKQRLEYILDTISSTFPIPGPNADAVYVDAFDSFFDQLNAVLLGAGLAGIALPQPGGTLVGDRVSGIAGQESTVGAAFASVDLPVTETLATTLGVRYTREERKYVGCTSDSDERSNGIGFATLFTGVALLRPVINPGSSVPTQFAQPGGCFSLNPETNNAELYRGKLDEDNVSGRVSLNWAPDKDTLLYLSYSRGFKSGSFPVISASDNSQFEPVTQEQLNAYETGGKLTLAERDLQFNYALFYYDYKDKQLLNRVMDPLFGPLPVLRNAPKSEVIGAELELQYSPIRGLFLSANGTYLDTEVKKFTGTNEGGDETNYAGSPFNFAPEWSATLLANYQFAVTSRLDVIAGIDYSYKSSTNSVLGEDPLYEHEAYGITNARLGIATQDSQWTLTAFARNVFDQFYTVSVFDPGDTVGRFTGMPRTIGLTLAWRME